MIRRLLDQQIPAETKTCCRRPSNAWFDDECRQSKRLLRTQERVAWRSGPLSDLSSPAVQTWRLQLRQYFSLLRDKKTSFWTARVNADQQHPRRLWQSFDQLLGRGCAPSTDISAPVLHKFFDDKIASVRATTDDAPKPMFTTAPPGCEFRLCTPVTLTDVIKMVQCSSDPLSTWLLKASAGLLALFLCYLFNWCLSMVRFRLV